MSHPLPLKSHNPREAVSDTLYRALIAFEEKAVSLFASAFAGDDDTTYMVSSIRSDLPNDTAIFTATAMNKRAPPETVAEPDGLEFWAGETYWINFV
ncbi:hypothetical protein BKA64DRAFT_745521 [Cadophora sp. MPI-SDFR-AT-0126]|nr:hypothetical protein BKA64DRAFT_745521 [Leotiomycetes sp. MPI-SDFR-AT-0126]